MSNCLLSSSQTVLLNNASTIFDQLVHQIIPSRSTSFREQIASYVRSQLFVDACFDKDEARNDFLGNKHKPEVSRLNV